MPADEGLIGLSSAFFVAGTKSLALTLWKVPSGETAEICVRFHELLKNEPNKVEALRQAQLDFLAKHPDKRHPFYWAAFIPKRPSAATKGFVNSVYSKNGVLA